jgi:hypothetical protein
MEQLKTVDTSNSTFENFINLGLLYVDKSYFYHKLITAKYPMFFLSRPRRMGKTLTVSALEDIFQGRKELFGGLYIYGTDYDWKAYPILHFSFNIFQGKTNAELIYVLDYLINELAKKHGIELEKGLPYYLKFAKLIDTLAEKEKVVILVDEYDKVLSDNIFGPEVDAMRATMKGFYEVIKAKEECLRFVFITGVTKYAKLSIFSTMNNLTDLTMDKDYATMLGYTQEEFESNFAGYIEKGVRDSGLPREEYLAKIRTMYDGFRFAPGCETVYNPVSIGKFFSTGHGVDFKGYWSETGGTQLLMDIARKVNFNIVQDISTPMRETSLDVFDLQSLASEYVSKSDLMALLLQTGYLTIESMEKNKFGEIKYHLRFPNQEVEDSFSSRLLMAYAGNDAMPFLGYLLAAIRKGETENVVEYLTSVLAGIPYPTKPGEYDFQGILGVVFFLCEPRLVSAEMHTSKGRIDMVLRTEKHLYVIEFKVDKSAEVAMGQIKSKEYVGQFLAEKGKVQIHLLGISLSSEKRNITEWKEELI